MTKQYELLNGKIVTTAYLDESALKDLQILQNKVIASLSNPSSLQPLSDEEFKFILQGKGAILGAFHHDQLIAFRAILQPENDEEHLGKDAGLSDEQSPYVIYSEISNVDPDYRGNHLQQLLGKQIVQSIDRDRYHYICATVAPFNIASLKDKFSLGMHIVALKNKYGGLLRYVFMKNLLKQEMAVREIQECQFVDMSNTELQQTLLADGWIGTGIEESNGGWMVCYEKR